MNNYPHDLRRIESRLNDWIILIITAIAIGFGMGLVNVVVELVT